ncbi:DUF202 domain-containing protein [Gymnodinialimonas sp. 57CJ19]|uniref:YidH family protein n=1 Tax=Gymnodinialimonas sp. 57CJ19 TaxID=3138498 RepID=UPI0031342C39
MTDDKEETATELAMERTDWAEDRTIMANERTFAGWMRTGMASVALALGMKAVFGDFEPVWAAKATASIFIVLACYIFFTARQQSCATQTRMNDHAAEPKSNASMTITATILSIGAIFTGVILWLL